MPTESAVLEALQGVTDPNTGLQNVQLLRWCREFGIEASWNILWGFPRESPADYAAMARLVLDETGQRRPPSADPRLGGRLALWGRRLMGEALTQAQRVAADPYVNLLIGVVFWDQWMLIL